MSKIARILFIFSFFVIPIQAKDSLTTKANTPDSSKSLLIIEGRDGSIQIARDAKIAVYNMDETKKSHQGTFWDGLFMLLKLINWWAAVVVLMAFLFKKQFVGIFEAIALFLKKVTKASFTKDGFVLISGVADSKDVKSKNDLIPNSQESGSGLDEPGFSKSLKPIKNISGSKKIEELSPSISLKDLGWEERKILRTLYNKSYQHDKNFTDRYTFCIFSNEFNKAIELLFSHGLVGKANPNQYAITNEGLSFIENNKNGIDLNGAMYE